MITLRAIIFLNLNKDEDINIMDPISCDDKRN